MEPGKKNKKCTILIPIHICIDSIGIVMIWNWTMLLSAQHWSFALDEIKMMYRVLKNDILNIYQE